MQGGAVPAAVLPLCLQPGKEPVERAFPRLEDIRTLPAQNLTHKASAVPGPPHDLLDRRPGLCQLEDSSVDLFSTQVAFILQPLRARQ
jgi:hypothetical protein